MATSKASSSAIKNAADYDKKMLQHNEQVCLKIKSAGDSINVMRCGVVMDPSIQNELTIWPYDEVYASVDTILGTMAMLTKGAFAQEVVAEEDAQRFGPASRDLYVMQHILTIDKLRTSVHLPKLKTDKSILERSSNTLKSLPQWSVLLNVVGHGITFKGREITAISFASGYKISENSAARRAGLKTKSWRFISILAFTAEHTPLPICEVTIDDKLTIGQSLESSSSRIQTFLKTEVKLRSMKKDAATAVQEETIAFAKLALTYLVYLLDHLNDLKSSTGKAASFKSNPSPDSRSIEGVEYDVLSNPKRASYLYLD